MKESHLPFGQVPNAGTVIFPGGKVLCDWRPVSGPCGPAPRGAQAGWEEPWFPVPHVLLRPEDGSLRGGC